MRPLGLPAGDEFEGTDSLQPELTIRSAAEYDQLLRAEGNKPAPVLQGEMSILCKIPKCVLLL